MSDPQATQPVPLVSPYNPRSHWQASTVLLPVLVGRTVFDGQPVHDTVAGLK